MLKERGVRTKFDPKMSVLSDVRATILIKTINVSHRVITVASYMKYMKLVSSEAAQSIVLGAKKSFRIILRNFVQGGFKLKRLVFQTPILLENVAHVSTFKIETKTFKIRILVDDIF